MNKYEKWYKNIISQAQIDVNNRVNLISEKHRK